MNSIKIAAIIAIGILIALFTMVFIIENPDQRRYDETVETLMDRYELTSVQDVLNSFPELNDIKSKMDRITLLKDIINRKIEGPSPNVSKEESLQLHNYSHEILQLRSDVNQSLSQLLIRDTSVFPGKINEKP